MSRLTDQEVYYAAVDTQGDDSHRSKINEHLGQKEDGSMIVATHVLMAARSKSNNYEANNYIVSLHEERFIPDEQVDCWKVSKYLIHDYEEQSTKSARVEEKATLIASISAWRSGLTLSKFNSVSI